MTTPEQTAVVAEPTPATSPGAPAGLVADIVVDVGAFTVQVSLAVAPGEVTCVLGPNGAGKTTLLRALAGLAPITSGRIVLDGDVLDDPAAGVFRPAHRRPVGVVFQDYLLFPHLSARGRRRARQIADGWLDRFGLADHAGRRPGQLSGGQAQRVALARALAPVPRLLLLDEPLAALDVATRSDVRAHLARTLAAAPTPVLLVTHDPLDAMILADRIVILEAGRIVQEGPAAEVARRPRTRYVARLVGLNLYAGTASGDLVTLDGGGQLHVPADSPPPGQGTAVLVAIRPTAVAVYTGQPPQGSPRNVLAGPVETLEPFGDRVRVSIASEPPIHADITAAALADLRLAPGTPVWATIKATDLTVYPAHDA
jgi:molybdate transport system ATP-binding protein